ncbi:acyl-CoA dehydrogenase [Candidatus Binatia bacterium]|jgi:acyl-CoA dehydrogenase|nr:acyl-CoA dehydrogenase [Candidatus Binatia bacterium]
MDAPYRIDAQLEQTLEQVFSTAAGLQPGSTDLHFDRKLWATLADLGFTRLTSQATGATWIEAAGLLRAAARHAAAVPVAENDLLAGWLVERAGLPDEPALIRTACIADASGSATGVPWATEVDRIVVLWEAPDGWRVADVPRDDATISPGRDLAGRPTDDVRVDLARAASAAIPAACVREYDLRGALARAVQSTGAMDRMLALSSQYATERVQFGRALAKFQAIQHLVADIACETALATAAVDAAVFQMASGHGDLDWLELAVAIARSVVGHAASVTVRNAHQVHGAIGTTLEHRLHELTKPVLAWRTEFGSLREWDARLTDRIARAGSDPWSFGVRATRA